MTDQHTPPPSDAPDDRLDVELMLSRLLASADRNRNAGNQYAAAYMQEAADTIEALQSALLHTLGERDEARSDAAAAEDHVALLHTYCERIEGECARLQLSLAKLVEPSATAPTSGAGGDT